MGLNLDDAVADFATAVGTTGPVTVAGLGTRGGAVEGVRAVAAPSGIAWVEPAEMTLCCGAGTPMVDVDAALAEFGQCLAVPVSGTIGGALAVGRSGVRRLGWGPVRDTLLQARYVSAAGEVVKVGGPTVKNVSGFDLCRLLVGSHGTLGFLAEVILRTRPRPTNEQWFTSHRDPRDLQRVLYRPSSILWDGTVCWVLLDGHPADLAEQAADAGLMAVEAPPELPPHRWSVPPSTVAGLLDDGEGPFVAEVGVGVVHRSTPRPPRVPDPTLVELHDRIKSALDPSGRLNPGVDVLSIGR